jgi:hypothetical protein
MGQEECALDVEATHGVDVEPTTPPLTTSEDVLNSYTPSDLPHRRSHLRLCQHQHLSRRASSAYGLHIDRARRPHVGRRWFRT